MDALSHIPLAEYGVIEEEGGIKVIGLVNTADGVRVGNGSELGVEYVGLKKALHELWRAVHDVRAVHGRVINLDGPFLGKEVGEGVWLVRRCKRQTPELMSSFILLVPEAMWIDGWQGEILE